MDPSYPDFLYSTLKILAALLLVLINGVFVAAEFAFVRVRPTRINQLISEGNYLARHVKICIEHLDAYLSVCQLGITIASLGLGWLGEPAVASLVYPLMAKMGFVSETLIHSTAFVIAFGGITFLHVVFGELSPKNLAIQRAESMALGLALPMRGFYWIFYPAVIALNGTANFFIRLLGLEPAGSLESVHSEEELQMLIAASFEGGVINEAEQELLQNVFRFEKRAVEDVMVPRTELVFLDREDEVEQNLDRIRYAGHTRYPYMDGSPDNVIGMIHVRNVFLANRQDLNLDDIKRDVLFVPEGMPLEKVLREFRLKHQHMAIVVDEYGGTAGAVFIDNVLEELVGDLMDEFDQDEHEIKHLEDGTTLVSGGISLADAIEIFDLPLDEETCSYNTLAGFFIDELDVLPNEGDIVEFGRYRIEVVAMKGMRIDMLKMIPLSENTETEESEPA